jgi:hypothetical protein
MGEDSSVTCPHPCACRWPETLLASARLCSDLEHKRGQRSPDEEHLSPRYRAALKLNHDASDAECDRDGSLRRELDRLTSWGRR